MVIEWDNTDVEHAHYHGKPAQLLGFHLLGGTSGENKHHMVSVYHICSLLLLFLPTLNQDSKIRKWGQIKGDSFFGWGFYRCSHPDSSWRESATFSLLLQLTWEENLDIRGQWQRLQTIVFLNPGSACKRKSTGAPVALKVCWAADKFISICHTAGAFGCLWGHKSLHKQTSEWRR